MVHRLNVGCGVGILFFLEMLSQCATLATLVATKAVLKRKFSSLPLL